MARLPRLDLHNVPQHVIQRGNNRQPCFVDEEDHGHYRQYLQDAAAQCGCAIHAYVLMTNHVHLLVTGSRLGAVSQMMQRLGRRYVACFNSRYRRTGTLWEGRFKASLVDSRRYLLTCYRYIELNPVRAAIATAPEDYRWSSYRANATGEMDRLITPHPVYLELGVDACSRQTAYRALFTNVLSDDELADIRAHVRQQKALGTSRFQHEIEAQLARKVGLRPRGRPRKEAFTDEGAANKPSKVVGK